MHIKASLPCPLLNTPDFARVFGSDHLPLDDDGLLRPVEMIALPETKFEIIEEISNTICKVTTSDYPHSPLFLDRRFTKDSDRAQPARTPLLPTQEIILSEMARREGSPYIWGGNWGAGIPQLLEFYGGPDDPRRTLAGYDCSGLLYEATNGYTPRNTSELLSFGKQIAHPEKPLDLILWPGHVIIVFDSEKVIESLLGRGVILTSLKQRLGALQSEGISFQTRRFFH